MKQKLLYIGLDFHREKTKSDLFFRNLLEQSFDVDYFWVSRIHNQDLNILPFFEENKHKYDAVVFWEVTPEPLYAPFYNHPNMIFIPMLDACTSSSNPPQDYYLSAKDFEAYKNRFKIISFSTTLARLLEKEGGHRVHPLQFYPKPQEFIPGNADEVFFWRRQSEIDFNVVKKLFINPVQIHIHMATDTEVEDITIPPQDIIQYHVTKSDWFDNKQDMIDLMNQKAIYIAPRTIEGIGMSFLDAMAYGKAIVGFNFPTMNEYIEQGKTGYLFDLDLKPIDFSNLRDVQRRSYESVQSGYNQFVADSSKVASFIQS